MLLLNADALQNARLLQSVEQVGHKWTAIVEDNFPGRTALSAKNQYAVLSRNLGLKHDASTPGSIPSSQSSPLICDEGGAWSSTTFGRAHNLSEGLDDDWEGISPFDNPDDHWDGDSYFGSLHNNWRDGADQIPSQPYNYSAGQSLLPNASFTTSMHGGQIPSTSYSGLDYPYQDTIPQSMATPDSSSVKASEIEVCSPISRERLHHTLR